MNEGIFEACQVLFDEKESFFKNHKIELPKETEEAKKEEPEKAGDSGASSNQADADGKCSLINSSVDIEKQVPEIIVQDADLLEMDDGNKADNEGWPDDDEDLTKNEKDQENNRYELTDYSTWAENYTGCLYQGFKPEDISNYNYHNRYDNELHCWIYSGPDFKVGDIVDAMKIEPEIHEQVMAWEHARIIGEDHHYYKIQFMRDDDRYVRDIRKEHYRTMLFEVGTHTREDYWRYNLQAGQYVDYFSEVLGDW